MLPNNLKAESQKDSVFFWSLSRYPFQVRPRRLAKPKVPKELPLVAFCTWVLHRNSSSRLYIAIGAREISKLEFQIFNKSDN